MKQSTRRMRRMSKYTTRKAVSLNMVSLMDVFTILVFFLLVNSSTSQVAQPPKDMQLPTSYVQTPPAETIVVTVTQDAVLVQGKPVYSLADLESDDDIITPLKSYLLASGMRKTDISDSNNVNALTVLADESVPYAILKKVMSSCAASGYGRISLAVMNQPYQD